MNILLIGGGGREHALAWAISASTLCDRLWCAPGNAGIAEIAECVALDASDHAAVSEFCLSNAVGLVVVGPEAPLVAGLVDDLAKAGIKAFGPTAAAARLEGSKAFTKEICDAASIPTAAYGRFADEASALEYLNKNPGPIVVKADGLAAGKGVTVARTSKEAETAVREIFAGRFGTAGCEVVIEELLAGEEASFFVLSDGRNILPLATAQDHKRVGDGDTGPNTGGMGAYSPAPVMTEELVQQTLDRIVRPTVAEMARRGTPYTGVLYAGLMITRSGPKLIEYNVRFGDPECQVLMMRLKDDIVALMLAATDGTLDKMSVRWSEQAALTVVMAARGYPGTPVAGTEIRGLTEAGAEENVEVFHAGTKLQSGKTVASGGRVLNITALGKTVAQARDRAYRAIERIEWPDGFYRSDIGYRAVVRERT